MKRLLPVLLVAFGCTGVPEDLVAPRVAPLELVASDDRVVLTPGGRATVRIQVRREAPDPEHPVQLDLELDGDGGDITATLSTDNTKADLVTLTLVAGATARDVGFRVRGHLGPYHDEATITVSVQIPQAVVEGDVEQYAPGVTGVMKAVVVDGVPLTIEVIDGLAILDGDIVLGDA